MLPPQTVHLPFEPGPYRMAMGLVACPPTALIELDDQYLPEMAERRALLDERHGEVFAALPESEAAAAEVLATVADVLSIRFPGFFRRDGVMLHNHLTNESWSLADPPLAPLELAGRLVQEDLCVLLPGPEGPVLVAAVLCFPSRWSLAEKLGRKLAAVHGPVPFYAERLARPVDRLLDQLRAGKLVQRLNWGLTDDPALFQPAGHGRRDLNERITAENAGETLFLRVERQTLSRLPASGATLFTIRTHRYQLARFGRTPEVAGRLAEAVRAMPPEMQLYKSMLPFRAALLEWLDAQNTK
ncbi:MAG TPA: DUF3445 domain-containing protein [Acetobacteraceae bacterium]|jgi:hypothetical protein